jgi:hypothetical protein
MMKMISIALFVLFYIFASAHAFDAKGLPFAPRVASPHNNAAFMPRKGPQTTQHQARPAFLASPAPKHGDSTALYFMDPQTSLFVAESSVGFKDIFVPVALLLTAMAYTIKLDPRFVKLDLAFDNEGEDEDEDTIPVVIESVSGIDQGEDEPLVVVTEETPVRIISAFDQEEDESSAVVTEEKPSASVEDDSTSTESQTEEKPQKSKKPNPILSTLKALYVPWLGMVFPRFK